MAPKTTRNNKRNNKRFKAKKSTNPRKYAGRKNFAAKRSFIVETKKNTELLVSERLQEGSFSHFIPISSFLRMNQGLDNDQFQGDDIFSKYISCKLNFVFPKGENQILDTYRIQVIHGWMTAPFALDTSGVSSYARDAVSRAQLDQIVAARVGTEWNQAVDRMNFRDKEKKIYKVEGKRWVTVNRTGQINNSGMTNWSRPDGTALVATPAGGPPDAYMRCDWKPMRKVTYTYSTDVNSSLPPVPYHYPNEAWVPFICVYTPDKDNIVNPDPTKPMPDESRVLLQSMNCHWYSDS